jgi:hypothetical protein
VEAAFRPPSRAPYPALRATFSPQAGRRANHEEDFVSITKALGKVFFLGFLQIAVLMGARFTAEEIEKLLNVMNRTRVVHIMKKEEDL